MKVGLFVVKQLLAITQEGFRVQFCEDSNGMMRVEFYSELDESFYEHGHLGFPGCPIEHLEKDVMEYLHSFRNKHGIRLPEDKES